MAMSGRRDGLGGVAIAVGRGSREATWLLRLTATTTTTRRRQQSSIYDERRCVCPHHYSDKLANIFLEQPPLIQTEEPKSPSNRPEPIDRTTQNLSQRTT